MNFSMKKTVSFLIIFFTCSFLYGAGGNFNSGTDLIDYEFYEKEDCIKLKLFLPENTMTKSTLYKIKDPDVTYITDPNVIVTNLDSMVAVRLKNDSLKSLNDSYYQLVDIEIAAARAPGEEVLVFEVIEHFAKKNIKQTHTTLYFFPTEKQVDFIENVLPKLTVSKNYSHIKYVSFFTKPVKKA